MGDLLPLLVFAAALAAVLAGLAWLAARVRRRGVGRELMGPIDLIYRPHAHHLNVELQQQEQRVAPSRQPDDPWRG